MRQQPITDESWNEAGATCLVRGPFGPAPCRPGAPGGDPGRYTILKRTVERDVIPRLLSRRRAGPARAVVAAPGAGQVERLVGIVLNGTDEEACAWVDRLRDGGVPIESLFLDLLGPAARVLGRMWEDDSCSFSDVTLGLGRLSQAMRRLGDDFCGHVSAPVSAPSALLVQMPGEQHGFGLAMVVQFFRRAGWNVRQAPAATSAEIVGLVRAESLGIIGISVSCSARLESLAADIRAVRAYSRNRGIGVMVGGPPFVAHPQLAAMVGADATAADGKQAVRQAADLLGVMAAR